MFSIEHLNNLRAAEIDKIIPFLKPGARILEIGAGTGKQAVLLKQREFEIIAIELADSNYVDAREFPIVDYDGSTIPLADASVDIVFSSNVLEHVPDLTTIHREIRRILKPNGYCIHILPTHAWRFWTLVTSLPTAVAGLTMSLPQLFPRALPRGVERARLKAAWRSSAGKFIGCAFPRRHGERGNLLSELWLFHPSWWKRNFRDNGFTVKDDQPMGLFYTGNMLMGRRLSLRGRTRLANIFGSACHLFKLVQNRPTAA